MQTTPSSTFRAQLLSRLRFNCGALAFLSVVHYAARLAAWASVPAVALIWTHAATTLSCTAGVWALSLLGLYIQNGVQNHLPLGAMLRALLLYCE